MMRKSIVNMSKKDLVISSIFGIIVLAVIVEMVYLFVPSTKLAQIIPFFPVSTPETTTPDVDVTPVPTIAQFAGKKVIRYPSGAQLKDSGVIQKIEQKGNNVYLEYKYNVLAALAEVGETYTARGKYYPYIAKLVVELGNNDAFIVYFNKYDFDHMMIAEQPQDRPEEKKPINFTDLKQGDSIFITEHIDRTRPEDESMVRGEIVKLL